MLAAIQNGSKHERQASHLVPLRLDLLGLRPDVEEADDADQATINDLPHFDASHRGPLALRAGGRLWGRLVGMVHMLRVRWRRASSRAAPEHRCVSAAIAAPDQPTVVDRSHLVAASSG